MDLMKILSITSLILLVMSCCLIINIRESTAIDCTTGPVLGIDLDKHSRILVHGRVLKNNSDNSVEIGVVQIYGRTNAPDIIHVSLGVLGFEKTLPLEINSEWIFVATQRSPSGEMLFESGWPCGPDWLEVRGDKVFGRINTFENETMSLADFWNKVRALHRNGIH